MAFEVLLVREGNRLAAADPISADAIAGIKAGETVTASIRRQRNPKHHRKLWALISVVYGSQNAFATKEDLLNALKLATGLFDTGMTVDKIPYVAPQSISLRGHGSEPIRAMVRESRGGDSDENSDKDQSRRLG